MKLYFETDLHLSLNCVIC